MSRRIDTRVRPRLAVWAGAALLLTVGAGCETDAGDSKPDSRAKTTSEGSGPDADADLSREAPAPRDLREGAAAEGDEASDAEGKDPSGRGPVEPGAEPQAPSIARDRGCGWHLQLPPDAEQRLADLPVLSAVLDGDLAELSELLASEHDPDDADGYLGVTALGSALAADCHEAVGLLLDAGADPELEAVEGFRPLLHAAQRGNVQAAERLIRAGADPLTEGGPDTDVFSNALSAGAVGIVELLLEEGVDPNEPRAGSRPLELLMSHPIDERIALLLDAGARPQPDMYYHAVSNDNIEAVRYLLALGLDPSPPIEPPWGDDAFDSPAAYARAEGRTDIAGLLEEDE